MKVIKDISSVREIRKKLAGPVGFVPTMGYLHEGHLSLVRAAQKECNSVVVSIFVNPTQFSPEEDLSTYPRDLERDIEMLREERVDLIWTPDEQVLYPAAFQTWVIVEDLAEPLEGRSRPGHFRGVATIVAKLFNVVLPDIAYFGQKDAQQAAVIQRMSIDLNFPVRVVVCPTVRQKDGLAMSSRNRYLNSEEREAATVLYRSLTGALAACERGERNAEFLRQLVRREILKEPLAQIDYISCADPLSLEELDHIKTGALFSLAVRIGKTRLIDNMLFLIKEKK